MDNREKRLEVYRESTSDPDMTSEQEFEFYELNAIRTKEILLETIKETKEYMCSYLNDDNNDYRRSDVFYSKLSTLFDQFYNDVQSKYLLEPLNDWWGYGIVVSENGISLVLDHLLVIYDDLIITNDQYSTTGELVEDEEFVLHTTTAKLLTLEEFGKSYNVSGNTVRQWIRRGKIKNALKVGNDWRISELSGAEIRKSIIINMYEWKEKLSNVPEEVAYINDYEHVIISGNKGKWHIILGKEDEVLGNKTVKLTIKEKEKIELFLISNPLVSCSSNYCGEIRQRNPLIYKTLERKVIELSDDDLRRINELRKVDELS
ncbi:helix-turn-helix domain-containing protein [Anaerovibrio lipolyticus]|uniref:helix-turn-helix domain-containing protein n=1 Tax=Anaerovibrio lipolyticus TaxID=82374 RepID=UPI0026F12868|nr:helix-turn-helix domain-containing protein [Anaerovibrio lipolyticus]MBE6105272.1 helix-turn-helix domain-containing protein [Anaerovibrio lipolyticus]